jgi:hypothetical protein
LGGGVCDGLGIACATAEGQAIQQPLAIVGPLALGVGPSSSELQIGAAVARAALLSSVPACAFSAICGGLLLHLSADKVHLVQVMMTCSIANQAMMVWAIRAHIGLRAPGLSLFGGMLGFPLEVYLLLHTDSRQYLTALGVVLIGYGVLMLVRKPVSVAFRSRSIDVATGFLGAVTGGAASPASAIWFEFRRFELS